jgi:site-specific DNA-methyltransferase (adenine-specific)
VARLSQIHGDVFDVLPRLPSDYFHGCVTDPPFNYSFMNRAFDRQHLKEMGSCEGEKSMTWNRRWLAEVYRVLVPGAYAAVFQGSRTYHRLAYAAELVGFEVLPMPVGLTGQSMAQGGNVGKLIDREAGAEREVVPRVRIDGKGTGRVGGMYGASDPRTTGGAPATPLAHDFDGYSTRLRDQAMPIALLLKPTEGSYAANARRWGVAGLAVDACRVAASAQDQAAMMRAVSPGSSYWEGRGRTVTVGIVSKGSGEWTPSRGRYPGNVILDSDAAEEVGRQSGERPAGGSIIHGAKGQGYAERKACRTPFAGHGDTGTAARFFKSFRYVTRANTEERRRGLEAWHWIGDPLHQEGWRRLSTAEALEVARTEPRKLMTGSNHPTLKPLELVRWVARLILPSPGPEARAIRERTTGSAWRLLVPFSGVLSEAIGASLAGWPEIVAIERSGSLGEVGTYVEQGAARWPAWGPYSEAVAEAIESAGGLAQSENHHAQRSLFGSVT